MKRRPPLIRTLARQTGTTPASAADQIDEAVNRMVRSLREGTPARLPGLGTFVPGEQGPQFQPLSRPAKRKDN